MLSLSAQVAIDDLGEFIEKAGENGKLDTPAIRLVEEAERALREGLARSPDFERLTIAESRLRELVGQSARAIATLKRTLQARPELEFVALTYARALRGSEPAEAERAVQAALLHHPFSRPLNQMMFEIGLEKSDDARDELGVYLRRAFVDDDGNVAMHVHALRFYYRRGDREKYTAAKSVANKMKAAPAERARPRFAFSNPSSSDGRFKGTVVTMTDTFAFIGLPGMPENAFMRPVTSIPTEDWDQLSRGSRVSFALKFNLGGPIASEVRHET